MSVTYPPSERYYKNMQALKELGGPGYGGRPEKDPDPEERPPFEKLLRQILCWLRYRVTGEKCKREEKDSHGHR